MSGGKPAMRAKPIACGMETSERSPPRSDRDGICPSHRPASHRPAGTAPAPAERGPLELSTVFRCLAVLRINSPWEFVGVGIKIFEGAREFVARQSAATDKLPNPPRRGEKAENEIWFSQRGALLKDPVEADARHPIEITEGDMASISMSDRILRLDPEFFEDALESFIPPVLDDDLAALGRMRDRHPGAQVGRESPAGCRPPAADFIRRRGAPGAARVGAVVFLACTSFSVARTLMPSSIVRRASTARCAVSSMPRSTLA